MNHSITSTAFSTVLIFSLFLTCTVSSAEDLAPKTVVVPDQYETIQAAIDAANEFDTIQVKAGVYREHLQIHKPLQVQADEGAVTIQWSGGGHVVLIGQCVDVVFQGFAVNGSGNTHWAGIRVEQSTNITIADNTVANGHRGIWLWDTQHCTFRNNHLYDNAVNLEVWGLTQGHFTHSIDESNTVEAKPVYYWVNQNNRQVPSNAGYVGIVNSSNIIVKDLKLTHNAHGVLLAHTENCLIENVSLHNNIRGIQLVLSDNNTFADNKISNCEESGIVLTASQHNQMINNHIQEAAWAVWFSFSPQLIQRRSTRNSANGNIIENNGFGVYLSESHNNTIINNLIRNNDVGLQISNSDNNTIYHNNFLYNTRHVTALGVNFDNLWDGSYPLGGNQWSGYSGPDEKSGANQNESGSDGIGDVPHLVHGNVYDRYPLAPPKIDFTFQPSPAQTSQPIEFKGVLSTPSSKITSWTWKLGDGSVVAGQNVTHTFSNEGTYTISLTVVDSRNAQTTIEKQISLAPSRSTDAVPVAVVAAVAAVLALSTAIAYFAWKLRKR